VQKYRQYSFPAAVKSAFTRMFDFSGRSRRSEYWWFTLFTVFIAFAAGVIDVLFYRGPMLSFGYLVVSVIIFFPGVSVLTRRLHDTGRSGWLGAPYWAYALYDIAILLSPYVNMDIFETIIPSSDNALVAAIMMAAAFVVIIWMIIVFIMTVSDSQSKPNRYGPSPKYGVIEDTFS